jgi:hypothetical protein
MNAAGHRHCDSHPSSSTRTKGPCICSITEG